MFGQELEGILQAENRTALAFGWESDNDGRVSGRIGERLS